VTSFLQSYNNLLLSVGTNSLFALSMYIALRSGVFSVATIGAGALGAYASAQATLHGAPFVLAVAAGVALAVAATVLLAVPVLRLSYMYLAIATLAFNEIIYFVLVHATGLTGGALGLTGIPTKAGLAEVYGVLAVVIIWFALFERSSVGRLSLAAGSDSTVVSSLGYPAGRIKLYALMTSLGIAGLAGALHAHYSYLVAPQDYGFALVTDVLSFVILGGLAAYWGPVLGAVLLTVLPESLRFAGNYRLLVSGVIVLIVVVLYPRGLVGLVQQGADLARRLGASRAGWHRRGSPRPESAD
jgi:branched-chain amino acid transport system permease protein